jgi:hypothetical protein
MSGEKEETAMLPKGKVSTSILWGAIIGATLGTIFAMKGHFSQQVLLGNAASGFIFGALTCWILVVTVHTRIARLEGHGGPNARTRITAALALVLGLGCTSCGFAVIQFAPHLAAYSLGAIPVGLVLALAGLVMLNASLMGTRFGEGFLKTQLFLWFGFWFAVSLHMIKRALMPENDLQLKDVVWLIFAILSLINTAGVVLNRRWSRWPMVLQSVFIVLNAGYIFKAVAVLVIIHCFKRWRNDTTEQVQYQPHSMVKHEDRRAYSESNDTQVVCENCGKTLPCGERWCADCNIV